MMKSFLLLYTLISYSIGFSFQRVLNQRNKNTPLKLSISDESNDNNRLDIVEEVVLVDSYDSSVKGGCIQNLDNHVRLLEQSLEKSRGKGVFEWIQSQLSPGEQSVTTVQQLHEDVRFGVLSHGTQQDPIYNYGNKASLELFEQTIDTLCRTPSRYSTVPELMEDRSNLIQQIETKGYGYIDDAIRVSAKGKLFRMRQILVWTVFDDNNNRIGLAAIYDRNGVVTMSENLEKGKGDHIATENGDGEPETKKSKTQDSSSSLSKLTTSTTNNSHQDQLMYLENPVSVKEFITNKLGCEDGTDSMHFTYADTLYQPMEKAPSVSRDIATKYLAPALDGVMLSAAESDCDGYAVVICDDGGGDGGGGLPKKERLFEALGLTGAVMEEREITMDELEIEAKDFKNFPYFQYTKDTCDVDDQEEDEIKAHQKITDVLAQHLTDHFKFDFGWPEIEDDPCASPIVSAPILCGGRATDGNIVAVVAMRVNT